MTSKEWKKCKLGEIAEFNPSESIKKGQLAKKIAMEKLIPYCKQIPSFERCKYNGGTKFRNGDTIMARITPCLENGKISKVTILNDNEIGFGSTEYIVFRAIENLSNPDFLYYLITSSLVREPAIKSMVGSSGRQRVQIDVVKNIEIGIPPLETQQKIASILSSIDDKIELNNSINNNLEQQAQTIFKSWFIDFEPFGGTMPNDWKYVELGKLGLDISDGNYSSKYPKTNEFVSKGVAFIRGTDFIGTFISQNNMYYITEEKHNQLLKGHTKKDDILITTRGDIGRIAFVPNSLINKNINSQLVRINGANIFPKSYLACSLLSKDVQNDFKSLITGSALQQLPVGRLKKILLLKPNKDILNKFDYICKPLFNMSFVNYEENNRLVNLRDTLLPKLMSGEIDVSEVDISTDKLLFIDEVINDKL